MFGNSSSGEFDGQAAKLGSILRKPASNGFFARKSDYVDSGNAGVIGVTNVVNRLYSGIENLPRANATQRDIEKYELSYGDMLFCRSSLVPEGVGKASVVPPDVQPGTLFECHVIRLPLDLEKCLPEFMQIQTSMMMFRRQVMAKAKTSTMTTIDQKSLLDCVVNLPPIEKQETFLVFLNQINKLRFDDLSRLFPPHSPPNRKPELRMTGCSGKKTCDELLSQRGQFNNSADSFFSCADLEKSKPYLADTIRSSRSYS